LNIELNELSYGYPGAQAPLFSGLNLLVNSGEITCLLGPPGAGKSTLIKLLAGLLPSYQGQILVAGEPLSSKTQDYYQSIGVLCQHPGFFDRLTVLENLNYFSGFYTGCKQPEELLNRLGLESVSHTLAAQLSKSMSQRLGLARAVLHNPPLLLLDQPALGLDPTQQDRVVSLLEELRSQGTTILLSTDQPELAERLAGQIVLMNAGQLFELPEELAGGSTDRLVEVTVKGVQGQVKQRFPMVQLQQNQAFLQLIADPGLESIHNVQPSLAQRFKQVTGSDL